MGLRSGISVSNGSPIRHVGLQWVSDNNNICCELTNLSYPHYIPSILSYPHWSTISINHIPTSTLSLSLSYLHFMQSLFVQSSLINHPTFVISSLYAIPLCPILTYLPFHFVISSLYVIPLCHFLTYLLSLLIISLLPFSYLTFVKSFVFQTSFSSYYIYLFIYVYFYINTVKIFNFQLFFSSFFTFISFPETSSFFNYLNSLLVVFTGSVLTYIRRPP